MGKSALIIGGGPAGVATAHQLTLMGGWDVTLVESAPHLGGGVRTFFHGSHPYTFGPRHFLTQNEKVFNYLNRWIPLRRCNEHIFLTYVQQDNNFYNYPIHVDDIERMPNKDSIKKQLEVSQIIKAVVSSPPANLESFWLESVGPTLYEKFINQYSQKMWGVQAQEIDTFSWSPKGVALKSGPRAAWDDAISAYPCATNGYNNWFNYATDNTKVYLNTKIKAWDTTTGSVRINGKWVNPDLLIITISPDIPFNYEFGELPYIGRDFHKIVLPVEFALPPDVYFIYEAGDEKWTRLTEFKKFTQHQSDQTLLGLEIPSNNGKYYPLPIKKHQRLAARYHDMMGRNVYCLGRSGCYRYGLDIAGCIEQAFELADVIKRGGSTETVIGEKWRTI